jgi:hypothetical protein
MEPVDFSPVSPYVVSVYVPDSPVFVALLFFLAFLLLWKIFVFIKQTFLF